MTSRLMKGWLRCLAATLAGCQFIDGRMAVLE
jgi:hypothetical protein